MISKVDKGSTIVVEDRCNYNIIMSNLSDTSMYKSFTKNISGALYYAETKITRNTWYSQLKNSWGFSIPLLDKYPVLLVSEK